MINLRTHHLAIVDLTEGEEALAKKQEILDKHDDAIVELSSHIQSLLTPSTAKRPHVDTSLVSERM